MTQKPRAPRPVLTFESKTLLDYVKGNTLREIKYSCVRAKELDDKQGSKKDGSYLLAMVELSEEINKELGIKAGKKSGSNKADKKLAAEVEDLKAEVVRLTDANDSLGEELEGQDEDLEMAAETNKTLNEANQALTKVNEGLLKPKVTTKKTTKKGAK